MKAADGEKKIFQWEVISGGETIERFAPVAQTTVGETTAN